MTETLAVIGLDAADYALLKRWDCQHILLDNNKMLETFTATKDIPLTTEVWPTVATGLPPKEHGLVATGEQQSWDNPILNLISSITSRVLSDGLRKYAGEVIRNIRGNSDIGMTLSQTDAPHPFYKGGIFGWPGLTDAENLLETWRWLDLNKRNKINEKEILRRLYENAGKEVGWLLGLKDFGYPVLGVHMHILDATGHIYADCEDRLKEVYQNVNRLLENIRQAFDHLLILSDHGIQVSWLNDENIGSHSMRASIASTIDVELPDSVFEVSQWIEKNSGPDTREDFSEEKMSTTEEQLRDLGYIN